MRLLAPEWLFIFGMVLLSPLSLVSLVWCSWFWLIWLIWSCKVRAPALASHVDVELVGVPAHPPGLALGLLRPLRALEVLGVAVGVALGLPLRTLGARLGLGLGLLLVRPDHHDHVAAVLLGRGLDVPELLDVAGEALQEPEPELGPVLLATAEHDRDLDLVALAKEAHHVTFLGLVVVGVDLRAKLHLFDDRVGLVAPCLTSLLGVLV